MSSLYQRSMSVMLFFANFEIAIQISLLLFQNKNCGNISKFKNQKNLMFYKYYKTTFSISNANKSLEKLQNMYYAIIKACYTIYVRVFAYTLYLCSYTTHS